MREDQHNEMVKALAVVCEITGTTLSEAAVSLMVKQLDDQPSAKVMRALDRCARECRYRLTLADVLDRIEEEDERDKARRLAAKSAEETQLRLAALEQRIPWELGKEKVRELLGKISLPDPAKEAVRSKSLAHWSETDSDD